MIVLNTLLIMFFSTLGGVLLMDAYIKYITAIHRSDISFFLAIVCFGAALFVGLTWGRPCGQ